MKNLMLVMSFFWILAINLNAQESKSVKSDSLIFDKTVHDYGTIVQGADGNCEFTFTNTGKEPIVLLTSDHHVGAPFLNGQESQYSQVNQAPLK